MVLFVVQPVVALEREFEPHPQRAFLQKYQACVLGEVPKDGGLLCQGLFELVVVDVARYFEAVLVVFVRCCSCQNAVVACQIC